MKKTFLLILIIVPNFLFAQLVNDMKVNLDTNIFTTGKFYSSVSSNTKGNTVVTWEVRTDSKVNIYAQIIDSLFNRVGNNFVVNSIPNLSSTSDVAVRKDGSFGIAWNSITENPYRSKVVLKVFNKNGIPISPEIQLSDSSKSYEPKIKIGTDSLGRFVVTFDYSIPNSAKPNVYFQIVDPNGVKIGNNVKVNQNNSYGNPSIAVSKNGSFVIAWLGSVNLYPKTIYCQMYSPNGIQIGNNVQVNENGSDTIDDRSYPDVAFDSSGNFVVGFKEIPYSSGVARIKYQRFDSNSNKIGANKLININSYVYQLSSDEDGNLIFLISVAVSGSGMYNLRIDKNDNPIGTYFLASNQFLNIPKTGNDILLINKKYINLWRDTRLGGHPQMYLNVRSYTNPDSVVSVNNISTEISCSYSLSQNYPNPFNPSTKIRFDVATSLSLPNVSIGNPVQLKVYDVMGREVQTLVNESLKPGIYEVTFDGEALTSGVYFYKLQCGDFVQTNRMVLIK
ncbi:MAG: T9SS type A sorting domain-containing protein [Ignavibacteria bacterium]